LGVVDGLRVGLHSSERSRVGDGKSRRPREIERQPGSLLGIEVRTDITLACCKHFESTTTGNIVVSRSQDNIFEFVSNSTANDTPLERQVVIDPDILAEAAASKERIRARLEVLATRFAGPTASQPEEFAGESVDREEHVSSTLTAAG
jgi:hypothetical protein